MCCDKGSSAAMKYKVTHTTAYSYSDVVPMCHNEVHLSPRDHGHQRCLSTRLAIKPLPSTMDEHLDYFGNHVTYFSVYEGHHKLVVTALSKVEVLPPVLPNPAETMRWEETVATIGDHRRAENLAAAQFVCESPFVR